MRIAAYLIPYSFRYTFESPCLISEARTLQASSPLPLEAGLLTADTVGVDEVDDSVDIGESGMSASGADGSDFFALPLTVGGGVCTDDDAEAALCLPGVVFLPTDP